MTCSLRRNGSAEVSEGSLRQAKQPITQNGGSRTNCRIVARALNGGPHPTATHRLNTDPAPSQLSRTPGAASRRKVKADWKSAVCHPSVLVASPLQQPAHDPCATVSRNFPSPGGEGLRPSPMGTLSGSRNAYSPGSEPPLGLPRYACCAAMRRLEMYATRSPRSGR